MISATNKLLTVQSICPMVNDKLLKLTTKRLPLSPPPPLLFGSDSQHWGPHVKGEGREQSHQLLSL